MNASEITDIFDDNDVLIGSIPRHEAEQANNITQNALIFIFNSKAQIWIQKRPKDKKHYPGLWDISACGGVLKGEEPLRAAQHEQLEEMGFKSKLYFVETFMNIMSAEDGSERRRLSHLYIGVSDKIPQPSLEVDEFLAVHYIELRKNVLKEPANYVPSFIFELDKTIAAYKML